MDIAKETVDFNIDKETILKFLKEDPELTKLPAEIGKIQNRLDWENLEAEIKAQEKMNIIEMRKKWSEWILGCIVGIVIFDGVVIFLLGLNVIEFNGHLAPIFIGESLLKMFGLAYVVVKFLFTKESLS